MVLLLASVAGSGVVLSGEGVGSGGGVLDVEGDAEDDAEEDELAESLETALEEDADAEEEADD